MVKFAKWASTFLAVFAGAGLAANNPGLVILITVLVSLVAFVWVIVKDKSPDLDTVIMALVIPSVLVSMNNPFAKKLNEWLSAFWDWVFGWAGKWLGTESNFVVAVVALALAYALMKRASGGSGMPSRIANGR